MDDWLGIPATDDSRGSVEAWTRSKCFAEAFTALDEIGQGVAIEGSEETVAGLRDHVRETANIRDNAAIPFDIEALDGLKRPLGVTNDLSDIDLLKVAGQLDATAFAAIAFDESAASQVMDDLDQMVARDAITLGDFRDVGDPFAPNGEIYEDPQRVVRVIGELHG